MASDQAAYELLQKTMARQRVTIYDLYGLLGVSPNVDEDGLRAAYDAITEKTQQVPSDVVNAAYSVLINPAKRAQYDRDRLEYLYKQFSGHEAFPPTADIPPANIKGRDDQIQVYTSTLVERVKDPMADKKKAINRRIDTIRNELDEFNETCGSQRQDWPTSNSRMLRMAGNSLCEIVVCAEADIRMLEDELGRIDGKLSPKDPFGPAGRVSSSGFYGSEIMAMPTGTVTGSMMGHGSQSRVLLSRPIPSIPRSPTVQFLPKSASKMGLDGATKDTPSSEGSQEAHNKADGNERVNDFLLNGVPGAITGSSHPFRCWDHPDLNNVMNQHFASLHPPKLPEATLIQQFRQSTYIHSPPRRGLIDWTRRNPGLDPADGSPEPAARHAQSYSPTGTVAANTNDNAHDLGHSQSAGQVEAAAGATTSHPTPLERWRKAHELADKVADTPRRLIHPAASGACTATLEASNYGFSVARPASRGTYTGPGAANAMLYNEVQGRAAAAAHAHPYPRAPTAGRRWVVGGVGLSNYHVGRDAPAEDRKKRGEDPFI